MFDFLGPPSLIISTILLCLVAAYKLLPKPYFWRNDLHLLGVAREEKIEGTAVICGGSIAGILSARVCADSFTTVVLVDPYFAKPGHENAKLTQTHVYLLAFVEVASQLWPTFFKDIADAGALIGTAQFNLNFFGRFTPIKFPSSYWTGYLAKTVFIRRLEMEKVIRKLFLASHPNIRVVDGSVTALVSSADKSRIVSVIVRATNGQEHIITDLSLVVDCTGSAQAGWKWLQSAGYQLPHQLRKTYDMKVRYLTVRFHVPEELQNKLYVPGGYTSDSNAAIYLYITQSLDSTGFYLLRQDNNYVNLCLSFRGSSTVPRDANEIMAVMRSIHATKRDGLPPWLLELMEILVSCDLEFKPLRLSPCAYNQYNLAEKLPSNFVAVGDAHMSVSPVYGQGFAKAAMQVTSLHSALKSSKLHAGQLPARFAHTFFTQSAPQIESIWDGNKIMDYAFETTIPSAGETLRDGVSSRWIMNKIISASSKNNNVAASLSKVQHMLEPSSTLAAPSFLWAVIRASFESEK